MCLPERTHFFVSIKDNRKKINSEAKRGQQRESRRLIV